MILTFEFSPECLLPHSVVAQCPVCPAFNPLSRPVLPPFLARVYDYLQTQLTTLSVTSYDRMIDEWWNRKDLEGSRRGLGWKPYTFLRTESFLLREIRCRASGRRHLSAVHSAVRCLSGTVGTEYCRVDGVILPLYTVQSHVCCSGTLGAEYCRVDGVIIPLYTVQSPVCPGL